MTTISPTRYIPKQKCLGLNLFLVGIMSGHEVLSPREDFIIRVHFTVVYTDMPFRIGPVSPLPLPMD